MRLSFLLAMLPALALGQGARPHSSTSQPATGGISSVSALGTCATEGKVVWLAPADELRVCDGTTWYQVHTSRDGALVNADNNAALRTLSLHVPAGGFALLVEEAAYLDLGPYPNDYIIADTDGDISANGWKFSSVKASVLGNRDVNANLFVSLARYLQIFPTASQSCGTNDAGGLKADISDGNRPYWCNGTAAYPLARIQAPTTTVDLASIPAHSCVTQTAAVASAVSTDAVKVRPGIAMLSGLMLGNEWVSASGTVSFDICNVTTGALDQPSTTFTIAILR